MVMDGTVAETTPPLRRLTPEAFLPGILAI